MSSKNEWQAGRRDSLHLVTPPRFSQAVLFRGRERLLRQRTELVNALRSVLYEFGHPVPPGIGQLKRIEAMVEAENSDLPELVHDECRDILLQIVEKTQRIEVTAKQIGALAKMTDTARRLQTMPGVGPISALAVEALPHPWKAFRVGRFCGLAGPGTAAAFVGRERASRTNIKGRTSRYKEAAYNGGDVAFQLARAEDDPGEVLAIWNVGPETQNACGYRACKQNGQSDPAHADNRQGLSASGTDCRCMTAVWHKVVRAGDGGVSASALWREMRGKGFHGQSGVVSEWAQRRRLAEKADQSALARTPSARSIAKLMTLARSDVSKSDAVLIAAIENGVLELTIARSLIADFQEMIRSKAVIKFDGWLERAKASLASVPLPTVSRKTSLRSAMLCTLTPAPTFRASRTDRQI